jgi:hypothetical protein
MPAVNFYKIVCYETNRVYVGSTCRPIERRLKQHEQDYKRYLSKHYHFISSFVVLEKNNYNIVLLDSVLCEDKKHRDTLETLHILNERGVNRVLPIDNRKHNTEKINEKIPNEKYDCMCGSVYIRQHKARHMKSKKHLRYEKEREKENE